MQQAALEIVIPLHQLHGLVGLLGARLVRLQHAQYATGAKRAQLCIVEISQVTKVGCGKKRDEVGFELLEYVITSYSIHYTKLYENAATYAFL